MARRNRSAQRLRWALLLIGVAVVLLIGVTGYQALKARTALKLVSANFETFSHQLTNGDQAGARETLTLAQRHSRAAADNTSGPGWWLSSRLPRLGPNVRAVRTVALVSDRLSHEVLPDVVEASGTLQPQNLRPRNGRVDLAPLRKVKPTVVRAATRLRQQARAAEAIDIRPLAPEIAQPVEKLQDKIRRADLLADRASRVVRLLPGMLGDRGTRRYVLAFQNNAEVRATGGIVGSFALLTARDGKLQLGTQVGSRYSVFAKPVLPLSSAERALFTDKMGRLPQNTSSTPDFTRTGELLQEMWRRRYNRRVDGVVSVDPVALSYVLQGTGPVRTAGDRRLGAGNVVDVLLSKVYAEISDPQQQDAVFRASARSVFKALTDGRGRPRGVLTGVIKGAGERRIMVWSSHRSEQQLIEPTSVGGGWPAPRNRSPQVGVYLDSARPSKLEYYLDHQASIQSRSCRSGRQKLRLKLLLHSRVPRQHDFLPAYVAPDNPLFERGVIVMNAYVVLPYGASPERFVVDGQPAQLRVRTLRGRKVVYRTVGIKPQQNQVVTVDMTTKAGQVDAPELRVTPGVRGTGLGNVESSSCLTG